MTITLYNSVAERDKLDKSSDLTLVATLTGYLRNGTSITDPEIVVEQDTLPDFNYIHIADFGRYYFVTKVVSVASGLWGISAHVDVLYSHATGILGFQCKVARNEFDYDLVLPDEMRVEQNKYNLTIAEATGVGIFQYDIPNFTDDTSFNTEQLDKNRYAVRTLR